MTGRKIVLIGTLITVLLSFLVAALIRSGVYVLKSDSGMSPVLRVGLTGPWNTLHPGLQHTLVADLVLSNQFEALVGLSDQGVSAPLGASSWEISDDFTVFRFKIDSSRRFPDGSKLSAQDYKRSLESSAKLEPMSANNSALDVLYKVEGFEDFEKTGQISGIKVIDEETLEIKFSTPFRMALEHLQGNRFSAYKEKDGRRFGTGIFQIEEKGPHEVMLHPRADAGFLNLPKLNIRFINPDVIVQDLVSGELDVIHYLGGNSPRLGLLDNHKINVLIGLDSLHLTIGLNSKKGSLFASKQNRSALQYLVWQAIEKNGSLLPNPAFLEGDPQFFMPLQAGRLSSEEVDQLIEEGRPFVTELIEKTKTRPIVIKSNLANEQFIEILRATGLHVSEDSGGLPSKEYLSLVYGSEGPDLLIRSFSIASGDSDGIYHVLGKFGAIRTPYCYSEEVSDLLESGRKIVNVMDLDPHYKSVTRALLREVPFIHLGFAKAIMAYRNDRVEVDTSILRRNQGQLHMLRAKQ